MKRVLGFVALLALLVVPTCASLPQYVQQDGTHVVSAIPAFPAWVPSRYGPVPITLVHHLVCRVDGVDYPAYGCFYGAPPRHIEIEDTLSPLRKLRYLRHETFHMAIRDAGLKFDQPDDEDKVAEAVAEQAYRELRAGWPR
jgi:hypothetical protein